MNTIYIGAEGDKDPRSFDGYIKEFKYFKAFHSFEQMKEDKLRIYRYHSFDDPNLLAYWKLSEKFGPESLEYIL